MKRNFLPVFLVMVLILPGAFILSICNPQKPQAVTGETTEKPEDIEPIDHFIE